MGNVTYVFERVERKFLLTPRQYDGLMRVLIEYMEMDRYGESTILSLYLDTADSLLIRRSLEKPVYKEKLRLRSYGVPGEEDDVFLEIKTARAIPMWLCAALDQYGIRQTSFSKYGRVYERSLCAGQTRAVRPAAAKGGIADAVCHV